MIDFMELMRETTKFRKDVQYLINQTKHHTFLYIAIICQFAQFKVLHNILKSQIVCSVSYGSVSIFKVIQLHLNPFVLY